MSKKKKRIKKVCEQCRNEFEISPSKADQRFCSKRCWYLWKSQNLRGEYGANWQGGNVKKNCEWCGKEFGVKPSRVDEKRFCSKDCWYLWKSKNVRGEKATRWVETVKVICKQCGKEFKAKPFHNRQFCSQKCWYLWKSRNQSGENSPNWKGRIEKVCEWCRKEFGVYPSHASIRFCSRQCAGLAISGKNHPNWQGGISFEPYPPEFNEPLKRAIRKRDNYTCAISGEPGKFVHHINYCKTDNRPKNLITLSAGCHGKTNANRDLWQALLGPIARSREGVLSDVSKAD